MGLPEIMAGIMLVSLMIYCVMAGADFGGGVWNLFASGPRARQQHELIKRAIGPIWEANHVWLILIIVLMFVCFPPAFAAISIALHIPLSLMLIGIIFRGSTFAFWSYDDRSVERQKRWGLVFSIASVFPPIMLGVSLGAATGGDIVIRDGTVTCGFFRSWLRPLPWIIGLFTLSLFSFLAAVYLACEARDPNLKEEFRRRGIASGLLLGVFAFLILALAETGAPQLWKGLVKSPTSWALHLLTACVALSALASLGRRAYRVARVLAIIQAVMIVGAWGVAEYPYLVRPELSIRAAAAPDNVLRAVAIAVAVGACILFPSLFYLYHVFKGRRA
jgi:cytochrome bd ubiquinol oxidase subunit II